MLIERFGPAKTPAFGIDLGTTNSCIAVIGNGNKPEIIPLGSKVTLPSCVMWNGGDSFVVGKEAYERRGESNVCYSVKRIMGTNEEVRLTYEGETRVFKPWEISSKILKALVSEAKQGIYKDINDVVITVPAYFTNPQIDDTRRAGEAIGLNILGIMKEPTAAALVYNQDNDLQKSKKILLYDLGGGTFDVSVVVISAQEDTALDDVYGLSAGQDKVLFSVLRVQGDMKLGGDDVDIVLARLITKYLADDGVIVEEGTADFEKILLKAELCKKRGIAKYQDNVEIGGKLVEYSIEPRDFVIAFNEVYQKTKVLVDRLLADPVVGGKVDQIITVGGSTKSEVIRESLKRDYAGVPLNFGMNPDESVALGAAIQAKRIKFGDDSINILDCLAMNIGLLSEGYINNVLVAGDQIPCSNYRTFLTAVEGADEVDLEVYQGLSRYREECSYIGTLRLTNLQTSAGKYGRIFLTLSVDSNGLLSIEAESGNSGNKKVELINVLGAKQEPTSANKKVVRWRKFVESLEDEDKREIGKNLLSQYINGEVEEVVVSTFIKENKKAVGNYTVNFIIGDSGDFSSEGD